MRNCILNWKVCSFQVLMAIKHVEMLYGVLNKIAC